ncbi:phospholipid-binding protein [Oricola nitratireducens]|uniref:phospholipid-binding protein n=1 Tax=Oricola nitratireducens TaxID=2775868 RepID=UPI001865E09A|nr:phospholipid-binding protein [Oricola nitratireducens]
MRQFLISVTAIFTILLATPSYAADFGFSFDWGNIKTCTSGHPGRAPNPIFKLKNVPQGTAAIRFHMKDINVPTYHHGGGKAKYSGASTIAPGAFKYKSPCPPGGRHTYEWTATALDGKGKTLAVATARKKYP